MLKSLIKNLRGATPEPGGSAAPARQARFTDRLSVIVPSVASRAQLFDTALAHFSACGMRWPIIVSDHSAPAAGEALAARANARPDLDLRLLRHSPDLHFLERLAQCAEAARTDYVVLHADDDFMFPGAMEHCVEFLDAHPDYAACKGRIVAFKCDESGVSLERTYGWTREEAGPGDRILAHMASFSATMYAVHRREVFIEACRRTLRHTDQVIFWQYLLAAPMLAAGKFRTLDELYYLRLVNPAGWRAGLVNSRDLTHWPLLAVAPNFSAELERFKNGLREALAGTSDALLEHQVDEACLALIRRALCGTHRDAPDPFDLALLERVAKPGSEENWHLEYCVRMVRGAAD